MDQEIGIKSLKNKDFSGLMKKSVTGWVLGFATQSLR
jgi:hypothetical protein